MSKFPSGVRTEDLAHEFVDRLRAFGLNDEASWVDLILDRWEERTRGQEEESREQAEG